MEAAPRRITPEMLTCVTCDKPLTADVASDSGSDGDEIRPPTGPRRRRTVPDLVELLPCGCHFHWQCLLDSYSVTECPKCRRSVVRHAENGDQQVFVNLENEGGLALGVDVLPDMAEEHYLMTYPEERKPRAFMTFCEEDDIDSMANLLLDEADEHGVWKSKHAILRYQDQLRDWITPLHLVLSTSNERVAMLLLLLASPIGLDQLHSSVIEEAQDLGLQREDQEGKTDLRSIPDSQGRLPKDYARELGGVWNSWLEQGLM